MTSISHYGFRRSMTAVVGTAAVLITLTMAAPPAEAGPAVSYVVDNAADLSDANPGDGVCAAQTADRPPIPPPAKGSPGPSNPSPLPSLLPGPDPLPGLQPEAPAGGVCTLRAAIEESNARPDVDHYVKLPSTLGVYEITNGQLTVTGRLSIAALDDRVAINARHRSRIFDVQGRSRLLLSKLFLAQGRVGEGDSGGAIRIGTGARVDLTRTVVVHSRASRGGGVFVAERGSLSLRISSIEHNRATQGGGLFVEGQMGLYNSSIYANKAAIGGGLYLDSDEHYFNMENLSILDNVASGRGGGLYATRGGLLVDSATVVGNKAGTGGGLYLEPEAVMHIRSSILAENTDAARAASAAAAPDCHGRLEEYGPSLIGVINGNCVRTGPAQSVYVGTPTSPLDPRLEPILVSEDVERWGFGELTYRRPAADSLAIDAVEYWNCPSNDMIGKHRPRNSTDCDFGAIER